jgi:hypothetical protein
MSAIQYNSTEEIKDRKMAIVYSFGGILLFLLLAMFIYLTPPIPKDVPPLNSDEVVEEFVLDNVSVQQSGGSNGGGTPSNDRIAKPTPQTSQYLTQSSSDVKINSGKSNNHSVENSQNTSSTSAKSEDPFGTGGIGGGKGGGKGKGDLFGKGNGEGNGEGDGFGDGPGGKERVRKNNINMNHIETATNIIIRLKLTVNANGEVVAVTATSITPKSTPSNIVAEVKNTAKEQLRFNEKPGAPLETAWYTVQIAAQ